MSNGVKFDEAGYPVPTQHMTQRQYYKAAIAGAVIDKITRMEAKDGIPRGVESIAGEVAKLADALIAEDAT